ncbi:MAG: hypothetical protein Q8R76_11620 [Candidatus Omnitrophota bacterium]|nr:hypothetical protein [Candidatus Omnitrophota bacterium]
MADSPEIQKRKQAEMKKMASALAQAGPSEHSKELKAKQVAGTQKAIFSLQREVGIFLVLVASPLAFIIGATLFAQSEQVSNLVGWGTKGFFLYPAYLVFRIVKAVTGSKK